MEEFTKGRAKKYTESEEGKTKGHIEEKGKKLSRKDIIQDK